MTRNDVVKEPVSLGQIQRYDKKVTNYKSFKPDSSNLVFSSCPSPPEESSDSSGGN